MGLLETWGIHIPLKHFLLAQASCAPLTWNNQFQNRAGCCGCLRMTNVSVFAHVGERDGILKSEGHCICCHKDIVAVRRM
ncbi:hypothetical protein Dimus_008166 [Dionaea muscipula]